MMVLLLSLVACGGSPGKCNCASTSAGTYQLMLVGTGSNGVTANLPLTLIVN
jgi:hypothetical protein